MASLGFVGTIEDDDDIPVAEESTDTDEEAITVSKKQKKKKKHKTQAEEFDDNFEFDDEDDEFESWSQDIAMEMARRKTSSSSTTLDEKIATVRRQKKKEATINVENNNQAEIEESEEEEDAEESDELTSEDEEKIDKIKVKHKKKKKRKGEDEVIENEKITYADEVSKYDEDVSFQDMNLSRPLLKALASMKFVEPTPIQAATIPVALLAKDVCACAATGTGKTAAFMLPVLERLLYKPKQAPVTRVLVLTPTRELAIQIHQVSRQLAQFTNVEISLSAGGLDVKAQEAALRMGPDVVIATPGRLIDHLHNAPNFNLQSVEILILDEADRMLDEYFAEQMKEVIRLCSRTRQTMLFSATMTEEVKDLAAISLRDPVKIFVNENTDVAFNLRQEFIRIRPNREGDREAVVAALIKRTFHDHCMIFIQTKLQAHRMHILLGLLGIKVGELHGNLSQQQRLEALRNFKSAEIDILLATDVAARGLDIEGVKTVINFTMPNTVTHYIHRVGRTARAGKSGRAVTLVGEKERRLLKEIVKKATLPVKSRVVPQDVIVKYRDRISSLEKDIQIIEQQEQEEKEIRSTENQVNKAQRILEQKEVDYRPKRTWFQTQKERLQEKASLRLGDPNQLLEKNNKNKKQKFVKPVTPEDRVQYEIQKAQEYAVRSAKRERKGKRIRAFDDDDDKQKGKPKAKKRKTNKQKSTFDKELTNTSKKNVKKLRAGPSYDERKEMGMLKKKKSGNKFKSKSRFKRR